MDIIKSYVDYFKFSDCDPRFYLIEDIVKFNLKRDGLTTLLSDEKYGETVQKFELICKAYLKSCETILTKDCYKSINLLVGGLNDLLERLNYLFDVGSTDYYYYFNNALKIFCSPYYCKQKMKIHSQVEENFLKLFKKMIKRDLEVYRVVAYLRKKYPGFEIGDETLLVSRCKDEFFKLLKIRENIRKSIVCRNEGLLYSFSSFIHFEQTHQEIFLMDLYDDIPFCKEVIKKFLNGEVDIKKIRSDFYEDSSKQSP